LVASLPAAGNEPPPYGIFPCLPFHKWTGSPGGVIISPLDTGRMAGAAYCAHGRFILAYASLDDDDDDGGDTGDGSSFIFLLLMVRSIGVSSLLLLRFMAAAGERAGLAGLFVLKSSTSGAGGERLGDTVASNGTSYGGRLDSLLGEPPLFVFDDGLLFVSLKKEKLKKKKKNILLRVATGFLDSSRACA